MKYIPLSDIDLVDNALNFNTADCYLIGGCDVFTTKTVRSEKALCQKIEDDLKTQNQNARFYSPGGTERATVPRPSPFGDLNETHPRQAFAYMLLTLNATHEFHDFRHVLTPNDFTECSLRSAQQDVDRVRVIVARLMRFPLTLRLGTREPAACAPHVRSRHSRRAPRTYERDRRTTDSRSRSRAMEELQELGID